MYYDYIKRIPKLVLKWINKFFILFVIFLMVIFYVMIFEISIPALSNLIITHINSNYKALLEEYGIDFHITHASFGWDTALNKPTILFKDIKVDSEVSIAIKKLAVSIDLRKFFSSRDVVIQKLHISGVDLNLTHIDTFTDVMDLEYKASTLDESKELFLAYFLFSLQSLKEDIQLYSLIMDFYDDYPIVSDVNEIIINSLSVNLQTAKHHWLLNFLEMHFLYNKKDAVILDTRVEIATMKAQDIPNTIGSIDITTIISQDENIKLVTEADGINFDSAWLNEIIPFTDLLLQDIVVNLEMTYDSSVSDIITLDFKKNLNSQGYLLYKGLLFDYVEIKDLIGILQYNIRTTELVIPKFVINSYGHAKVVIPDVSGIFLIKGFELSLFLDLIADKLDIQNMILDIGNDLYLNLSFQITDMQNVPKILFNLESESKIGIEDIKARWPSKIAPDVRLWVFNNIDEINISSVDLAILGSIDPKNWQVDVLSFDYSMDIVNAQFSYVTGMSKALINNALFSYNNDGMSINFKDADTGNILVTDGSIRLYEYVTGNTVLEVDLRAESDIINALNFINNKPLELVNASGLNIDDFSGEASGIVKLIYSISFDSMLDMTIDLDLHDVEFKSAFLGNDATRGSLKLISALDSMQITGQVFYLDNLVHFDLLSEFTSIPLLKYTVSIPKLSKEQVEFLGLVDFQIIPVKITGDFELEYVHNQQGTLVDRIFNVDLKSAHVSFPVWSYNKPVDSELYVSGSITSILEENYSLRDLQVKADDLEILLEVESNDENIILYFEKFNFGSTLGRGLIEYDHLNDIYIDFQGESLDITGISNFLLDSIFGETATIDQSVIDSMDILGFEQELQLNDFPEDENTYSYHIELQVDTLLYVDEAVANVSFEGIINGKSAYLLDYTSFIGQFDSTEISEIIFDSQKGIASFEVHNFGHMFKFLGLSEKIEGGILKGDALVSLNDQNKILSNGSLSISEFVADLSFNSISLDFSGEAGYFTVNDVNLEGGVASLKLNGYVDIPNNDLHLLGSFVLITLDAIAAFPVTRLLGVWIKELLNFDQEQSLIQSEIAIFGSLDSLKYMFNPGEEERVGEVEDIITLER